MYHSLVEVHFCSHTKFGSGNTFLTPLISMLQIIFTVACHESLVYIKRKIYTETSSRKKFTPYIYPLTLWSR